MRLSVACLLIPAFSLAATTIDRIVAAVGKRAIKQSDIERDVRVTQFLNQQEPQANVTVQKQSLERLIDQQLIRADMAAAGNTGHLDEEANGLLEQIVRDRFGGSRPRYETDLRKRGLNEPELVQQLQWQLVVLRFIDQRFRPGVIVTPEEVQGYYEQHKPGSSLESAAEKIKETLEAEAINRNFEQWLGEARKNTVIQYKVAALK